MSDKAPYSVLVVEDEEDILKLMCLHLSREGYQVDSAQGGKEAYQMISSRAYQLIILDWMIPEISGLELLKWIRKFNRSYKEVPILFVTAKSAPEDIVRCLEMGADDYITKPFDFDVFKARVKNLLKRIQFVDSFVRMSQGPYLRLGALTLDTGAHKVSINQKEVSLTFSEFRLLESLLSNQGKVLSRKQMIHFIQGEDVSVVGRTVDTHMSILRKKLGEYGQFIETVRGVGYRIGFI